MANQTSGAINTLITTRDDLILDALQDLRVVQDGNSPSAGDLMDAARKLNFMIKLWATKGRLLWCLDLLQIPLVVGQQNYTIGPTGSGANIISYRPLRVLEGSFLRSTNASGITNDITIWIMSQKEYNQQSAKGALGTVTSLYYDPQMTTTPNVAYNPALSKGILNVWTTQSTIAQTQTIFLRTQRPIQEMINADDALDMPVEWYNAVVKNLRAELSDKFEIPEQRLVRLKQEAKMALDEIVDWAATEEAPVSFQPDYQEGMQRGYA